ncbi:E3 Ubiquitin ligase family protein [Raphanus sativus]|nr:E3 Ubiquitin ligase family protein [Raphanus sativus]
MDSSTLNPSPSKQVPWFLEDGTGGRVNVSGSESELGLALTVAIEVFEKHDEPSSLHLPGTVDDYLQGREMLGVRGIEYVLPIGTRLTVVGELQGKPCPLCRKPVVVLKIYRL